MNLSKAWLYLGLVAALLLSDLQPVEAQTCESLFKADQSFNFSDTLKFNPRINIDPGSNIFNGSLVTSVPAAFAWLSLMEVARYHGSGLESWDLSLFALNTSIDVTLTLVSHTIAIGRVPFLSRFFSGQPKNFKESVQRVGANVALSTSIIYGIWSLRSFLGNSPLPGVEHLAIAATLTTLVYPVLQAMKESLFIKGPRERQKKKLKTLSAFIQNHIKEINKKLINTYDLSPESQLNARDYVLSAAEAYITSQKYEEIIEGAFTPTELNHLGLTALLQEIKEHKNKIKNFRRSDQGSPMQIGLARDIQKMRRRLLNQILRLLKAGDIDNGEKGRLTTVLMYTSELKNRDQILEFHYKMSEFSKSIWPRLFTLSMVDMGLSVGFAGGVLLYGVNGLVVSGLPISFVNLISQMF